MLPVLFASEAPPSLVHAVLGFLDFVIVIVANVQAMTASSSESMFVPHTFGGKLDSRVYIMVFRNKFLQLVSVCMETLFLKLVSRNMFPRVWPALFTVLV